MPVHAANRPAPLHSSPFFTVPACTPPLSTDPPFTCWRAVVPPFSPAHIVKEYKVWDGSVVRAQHIPRQGIQAVAPGASYTRGAGTQTVEESLNSLVPILWHDDRLRAEALTGCSAPVFHVARGSALTVARGLPARTKACTDPQVLIGGPQISSANEARGTYGEQGSSLPRGIAPALAHRLPARTKACTEMAQGLPTRTKADYTHGPGPQAVWRDVQDLLRVCSHTMTGRSLYHMAQAMC